MPGSFQCFALTLLICINVLLTVIMVFSMPSILQQHLPADRNHLPADRTRAETTSRKKPPKLILLYSTFWGNRLWTGFETTERFNNWGGHPCKVQNCRLTYNRKKLAKADVVIFHAFGDDMLSARKIQKLQKERNPNSYWIYFIHESPQNAKPDPALFNGIFNLTMGYRRDADIVVPYNWEWGSWERRGANDPPLGFGNFAEGKDKLIWGGISHCGCIREKYLKKLNDYIHVDLYGKCAKNIVNHLPPECPRGSSECKSRLKKYKFYIAFENSFCEDYVSEKFTETVFDGHTVPVVMGGAKYNEIGLPNSFIDVNDFETIKDLAEHLKYLDDNDDAYNKYFEFRKHYKIGKPRAWSCKICELINVDDLPRKIYHNLGDWYSVWNNCGTGLHRVREILHNSKVPPPYTDEYYTHDYKFG